MKQRRTRPNKYYFYLTDEEKEMLADKAAACGLSRSDYLRSLITRDIVTHPVWFIELEQGKEVLAVLNGIHNDLMKIDYRLKLGEAIDRDAYERLRYDYDQLLDLFMSLVLEEVDD